MARPQTLYRAPKGATLLEGPKLTAGEIAAGTPPKLREAGRMLDCTATMDAEPVVRYEWVEGQCAAGEVSRTYPTRDINLTCALRSAADVQNIIMAWQGGSTVEAGGTAVTDEPTRSDVADGDTHILSLPSDGTATITDSDVGPTSLVEGTDWEWLSGSAQIIRFLNTSGFVQPFLVTFNTAAVTEIGVMSQMYEGAAYRDPGDKCGKRMYARDDGALQRHA